MLGAFATAYGIVLVAELPDKTMFASVVLTTRWRRPLAVWCGAVSAFAVHVTLAVAVGSLLSRLPRTPLQLAVGALFVVGAALLWRERGHEEGHEDAAGTAPERLPFPRVAVRSAMVLGLAELGDLTQLATAGLAVRTGEPVAVGLGAWSALATVAALAVLGGRWIERTLPLRAVRTGAAVLFLAFGTVAIVTALIGG